MNRRSLLAAATLATAAQRAFAENASFPISTNVYPWGTFARRRGEKFDALSDAGLAAIAESGLTAFEPILNTPADCVGLGARLEGHGIAMPSFYMNSVLHDEAEVEASIANVLATAEAAAPLGAKILVTNPSPIRWGGEEDKDDAQLRFQADALDRLGAGLRQRGLALAYHNHASELRQGAREFHHMLTATDPENVKFCLDAHWIFRGCGDSEVALFDAVEHYADRIVELHLRQSQEGVWTEVFSAEGDIDYGRLAKILSAREIHPHLVLEQAVEKESTDSLSAIEAHRAGAPRVAATFLG